MFFESFLLNLTVIVVLIFALLYDYITKFFSYWYVRHIPFKTPYPCFGSDLERVLGFQDTTKMVNNLYVSHLKERFVGCFKARIPDLIVKDPDVIKLILSNEYDHFKNKGLCLDISSDICLRNNLFYAEGEKWSVLREQIGFILKESSSWNIIFDNITKKCVKNSTGKTNINKLLGEVLDTFLVTNVMNNSTSSEFIKHLRISVQNVSLLGSFKSYLKNIFPSIYRLFGMSTLSITLLSEGRKTIKELSRSESFLPKIKVNEVNKLVDMKSATKAEDLVIAALYSIISEAYIPCYNTIISILYELAKNGRIQSNVRDAIIINEKNNNTEHKHIENDYLDRVIKESLRLYPTYSTINRKCVKAFKIPDTDIIIDKGVTITIPVESIHKDSKYFIHPDQFDPDRFSAISEDSRTAYTYIPFSEGPRKCPGANVSHNIIKTVLSVVISQYRIETCAETPDKLIYKDYDFKRMLMQDIWLNFTPLC